MRQTGIPGNARGLRPPCHQGLWRNCWLTQYVVYWWRNLLARKWWLPPRRLRAALPFGRPPRNGAPGPPGFVGPARGRRSSASLPRSSARRFSCWGAWLRRASGCSAPAGAGTPHCFACGRNLQNNGKEESYERNPGRANRGMSLTGQATTERMEKTCEIVEKLSTVQSNSGRIYSILGSLQYCHQYGPAKKFGT